MQVSMRKVKIDIQKKVNNMGEEIQVCSKYGAKRPTVFLPSGKVWFCANCNQERLRSHLGI